MAKFNLLAILGAALVASANAMAGFDINAVVDGVGRTVAALGFTGAGSQNLGYGFAVEYVGFTAVNEEVEVPEGNGWNPNANGEINYNNPGAEAGGVEIPDEIIGDGGLRGRN